MSIQYTMLGFELTTFGHESPPITIRPGLYLIVETWKKVFWKIDFEMEREADFVHHDEAQRLFIAVWSSR